MQRSRLPSVARQLLDEVPDADLLEHYAQRQSDDAFAQLVVRYSRLVWGQCRNLLANDADADDAFQATFLTLARSVAKLKPGLPLGPWLHGVAFRVCKNARRSKARRTKREKASAVSEASRPVADSQWESAFAAVAEEVQKLPEAQRAAFVLCCIEGRATTDAAASLGQKLGTFSARLTRAKQSLLDRLAKRGLGAGVLALGGVTGSVAVAPAALIERTLALIPSGVVVPGSVQILMQGVTGMTMIRIKLLAAGVMVATGFGLSVGGGGWSGEATAQVPGLPPAKVTPLDPNLEKLKADLERAKAQLMKAERDAEAKEVLKHFQLRIDLDTAPKYEYESLPEGGLSIGMFEKILAEREKNGWEFLGQVTLMKDTVADTEPKLVFRKKPPADAVWLDRQNLPRLKPPAALAPPASKVVKPSDTDAPPAFAPVRPGAALPTPTVGPGGPILPLPTPGSPPPGGGAAPSKAGLSPLGLPVLVGDGGWGPDSKAQSYLERIAELEKLVEQLRGKSPIPVEQIAVRFTKSDFGKWDPKVLAEVLDKVMAEDFKAKRRTITYVFEKDGFSAIGSSDEIQVLIAWIEKLKK